MCHVRIHSKKIAAYKARRGLSPEIESIGTSILDLPVSRSVTGQFLLFNSHKVAQWERIRLPREETARDTGLIPESGRSPGVGNGNLLQYSCRKNFMDKRGLEGYSP